MTSYMIEEELRYGNQTAYGISSDGWRHTWAAYLLFVALSSLIGDTTILILSIKYKAIKLHEVIVVIIQHIALSDLMVVLTDVLTKVISVLNQGWVFGTFMCRVAPAPRMYFVTVGLFLVGAMTTSKTLLLKYPLRFGSFAKDNKNVICALCWVAALVSPGLYLYLHLGNKITYFSYRGYQCDFKNPSPSNNWLKTFPILVIFTPACIVLVTTVYILLEARRVAKRYRDRLRWQGTMAALMTALLYLLSVLPHMLFRIIEHFSSEEDNSFMFKEFYRMAISFHYINTISNFYVYCMTVASFREFLVSILLRSSQRTDGVQGDRILRNRYAEGIQDHDIVSADNLEVIQEQDNPGTDDVKSIQEQDFRSTDDVESIQEQDIRSTVHDVESIQEPDNPGTDDVESIQEQDIRSTDDVESIQEQDIRSTVHDVESIQEPDNPGTDDVESIQEQDIPGTDDVESIQEQDILSTDDVESIQEQDIPGTDDVETIQEQDIPGTDDVETIQEQDIPGTDDVEGIQEQDIPGTDDVETIQEQDILGTDDVQSIQELDIPGTDEVESIQEQDIPGTDDVQSIQELDIPGTDDVETIQEQDIPGTDDFENIQEQFIPISNDSIV